MATHSSILAWRIPTDRGAWQAIVHWIAKSQTPVSMHDTYVTCIHICIYLSFRERKRKKKIYLSRK